MPERYKPIREGVIIVDSDGRELLVGRELEPEELEADPLLARAVGELGARVKQLSPLESADFKPFLGELTSRENHLRRLLETGARVYAPFEEDQGLLCFKELDERGGLEVLGQNLAATEREIATLLEEEL